MIDAAIQPGLAPGGVVMRLYAGTELVNEQRLRSIENFDADVARMAAEYSGNLAVPKLDAGGDVTLVVYDGDDGTIVSGVLLWRPS
jgi:hypothetical protein